MEYRINQRTGDKISVVESVQLSFERRKKSIRNPRDGV